MPLLLSVNTVIGYLNYVIIESNHVGFSFMLQLRVAPMSLNTIREVVQQNKTFKKEHVMDRLQQSLSSKLEEDNIKV